MERVYGRRAENPIQGAYTTRDLTSREASCEIPDQIQN